MRIEIKTNGPVKDNDLRGMYIISFAFSIISPRMIRATLEFFASRYGFYLIKKP